MRRARPIARFTAAAVSLEVIEAMARGADRTNANVQRWLTPDADKLFLGYATPAQQSDSYKGVTAKRTQESYNMQCADIEGAAASTLKTWRPRTTPTNPLEPNYGWIDGRDLGVSDQLMRSSSKPRQPHGPLDEVNRLMQSTGKLQEKQQQRQRRQRKDFRNTNDISDIEGATPKRLIGVSSEGIEIRRGVALPLDTQSTWRSERANIETAILVPKNSKEHILAQAGFPPDARERLMRRSCSQSSSLRQSSSAAGTDKSAVGTDVRRNNFEERVHELKLMETHLTTPGVQLDAQPFARGNRHNLRGGAFQRVPQQELPRSASYIGGSPRRCAARGTRREMRWWTQ